MICQYHPWHTCQFSWIRHQSPALPYGTQNLKDKIEYWAFLSFNLELIPSPPKIWIFFDWFLGHFCTYFITDKDHFTITIKKANCDGLYLMSDFIYRGFIKGRAPEKLTSCECDFPWLLNFWKNFFFITRNNQRKALSKLYNRNIFLMSLLECKTYFTIKFPLYHKWHEIP